MSLTGFSAQHDAEYQAYLRLRTIVLARREQKRADLRKQLGMPEPPPKTIGMGWVRKAAMWRRLRKENKWLDGELERLAREGKRMDEELEEEEWEGVGMEVEVDGDEKEMVEVQQRECVESECIDRRGGERKMVLKEMRMGW